MRLNRFIAETGFCSRRKADWYIMEGRVKIRGKTVREPWVQVKPSDPVYVDDLPCAVKEHVYLMVNKPKGVTTTLSDRYADKKISDLLPQELGRVFPVGRLDKNSRGLILMTTDGDLCYKLTHPKFEVEKEYQLKLAGVPGEKDLGKAQAGLISGSDFLKVRSARIVRQGRDWSMIRVIVCEGKKRHLRRLFSALGFKVLDLKRIRIGSLTLDGLKEGELKKISYKDIAKALQKRGKS